MNMLCRKKCEKCGWESGWFYPSQGHQPSHFCIDREKEKKANEFLHEFGLKPKTDVSPLQSQVGGDHYRKLAIQPVEFIHANKLNFLEGCIVKRICRHRSKNGRQDLEKIIHEVQLLIAIEYPEERK